MPYLRVNALPPCGNWFTLHRRKTRVLPSSQRQKVAGLVVNAQPNVPRDDYDALRALLHNCVRFGPESQNHAKHERFHEHLQGRIAWVTATNAARGRKLRSLWERIEWAATDNDRIRADT